MDRSYEAGHAGIRGDRLENKTTHSTLKSKQKNRRAGAPSEEGTSGPLYLVSGLCAQTASGLRLTTLLSAYRPACLRHCASA